MAQFNNQNFFDAASKQASLKLLDICGLCDIWLAI
jgi:hypothetical protein